MRLVEFTVDAGRPTHVELHPRFTALLAPSDLRDRLAEILTQAWVLAGTELTGVLDAGGYQTPLDPTAVVALDLDGPGLITVRADQIPPPDPHRREASLAEAAARRDECQACVARLSTELAEATRRRDATAAAVAAGEAEAADARSRAEDLDVQRKSVDGRPAALAAERTAAIQAADAARARIQELIALRERLEELTGADTQLDGLRSGDDTSDLVQVVERAGSVGGLSPETVRVSVTWLEAVAEGTASVRAEAAELIQAESEVEHAWQGAAAAGVEGAPEVLEALAVRGRLVADRDALESLQRSGLLGDTARREIESAHAAASSSKGPAAEESREEEDRVLARFGFDSYLDFTIAMSTRSVGQKAEGKLQQIIEELARAEEELSAARVAAAARLEALADAREPVRARVAEYLGERPDGPGAPLLARIPEVPAEAAGLHTELCAAIDAARAEVIRHDELVEDLDDEAASLEKRLDEIDQQRAHMSARIEEIEQLLVRARAELGSLQTRCSELDSDRRSAEAELAAAWRSYEAAVDGAQSGYQQDDLESVVEAVTERLGGDQPALLIDTFAPLGARLVPSAVERLLALVPGQQVLYLTDDFELTGWARSLNAGIGRGVILGRRGWWPKRLGRRVRSSVGS